MNSEYTEEHLRNRYLEYLAEQHETERDTTFIDFLIKELGEKK